MLLCQSVLGSEQPKGDTDHTEKLGEYWAAINILCLCQNNFPAPRDSRDTVLENKHSFLQLWERWKEHCTATGITAFRVSLFYCFIILVYKHRMDWGCAQVLAVAGDLICCISNFSDFWRIISLPLPHVYKEVTVLKFEPLQLEFMKQVMQRLLSLSSKQYFHQ